MCHDSEQHFIPLFSFATIIDYNNDGDNNHDYDEIAITITTTTMTTMTTPTAITAHTMHLL